MAAGLPQIDGVVWNTQIGPQIGGPTNGYAFGGNSLGFYVLPGPGSDPGQTYAYYSADSGGSWVPIANNQAVSVQAAEVEWQLVPPAQGMKFVIGTSN